MVSNTSRNGGDNMIATNRRRTMGKVESMPADVIMTTKTNPAVLAICYAQGWCANPNYMTKSEAEAVTSVGTVFQNNTAITHFDEFEYFTGITALSANAFNNCLYLQRIKLPNSLITIGNKAFYSDNRLTQDIVIPEGVTTIESGVFQYGAANIKITIPSTVTSIGTGACGSAKTIIWNSNVQPNQNNCAIYATTYLSDVYECANGMLFKDNYTTLWAVPIRKGTVNIPNTVTTVSAYACKGNSNIALANRNVPILSSNIKTIGTQAFYYCNTGDYLVIPEGVETIGGESFRYCNFRLLYVPSTCSSIGGSAFSNTPNSVTNRIAVINSVNRPTNNSMYTFTCREPKWKIYVPVGATGNYPIANGQMIYSGYVQSVSEIPSTFDTSSTQAIKNSLDALDAL